MGSYWVCSQALCTKLTRQRTLGSPCSSAGVCVRRLGISFQQNKKQMPIPIVHYSDGWYLSLVPICQLNWVALFLERGLWNDGGQLQLQSIALCGAWNLAFAVLMKLSILECLSQIAEKTENGSLPLQALKRWGLNITSYDLVVSGVSNLG